MTSLECIAKKMFSSALKTVMPDQLVRNALHLRGNKLVVNKKEYELQNNVYVVGFGKAVYGEFI